jgi:hypothetical protein
MNCAPNVAGDLVAALPRPTPCITSWRRRRSRATAVPGSSAQPARRRRVGDKPPPRRPPGSCHDINLKYATFNLKLSSGFGAGRIDFWRSMLPRSQVYRIRKVIIQEARQNWFLKKDAPSLSSIVAAKYLVRRHAASDMALRWNRRALPQREPVAKHGSGWSSIRGALFTWRLAPVTISTGHRASSIRGRRSNSNQIKSNNRNPQSGSIPFSFQSAPSSLPLPSFLRRRPHLVHVAFAIFLVGRAAIDRWSS